ncbi:MAG: FHA domain-containing protein [Gammaproteobacteria bacterium]|jgi:pSer/pThr/pTyr-binding forkhead associated (FHA) protein|nr:FHA domain-containing protein [Gammaproteobacteria bacterium]
MATLQKLGDEALCPLNLSNMRIGRSSDNEIVIADDSVSGHHARITRQKAEGDQTEEEFVLEDLSSTNATYVNNKEVTSHPLKDGDIIRLGRTRLKFSTREYQVPAQQNFQKTQKLSKSSIMGFLFSK